MTISKALYISQEIAPYVPANAHSELGRALPRLMQAITPEVRTFMPKYGRINERRNQLHEVIRLSGLNIVINECDHPLIIKVATMQPTRLQVYFIDNDDYFGIPGSNTTLETDLDPKDNDERMIFFTHGVIETAKKLRWVPDLVNCMGWITALVPLYMRTVYGNDPTVSNSRVSLTITGDTLPRPLQAALRDKLLQDNVPADSLEALGDGDVDTATLYRLGIDNADAIAVADPNVDPAIIEYARTTGKPLLEYPGEEDLARKLNDFFTGL